MKTLFAIIALFICVTEVTALTEKENIALQRLDKAQLENTLKKIIKDLQKQTEEKTPIPTQVFVHACQLKTYNEHPFVEADTGIPKKWYKQISKSLNEMAQIKSKQKLALISKNIKDFNQCDLLFKKELSKFIKTSKKPTRVEKKRLQSLRKTARKKRKELERRLKKEEKLKSRV
jgi:hypothetical protein